MKLIEVGHLRMASIFARSIFNSHATNSPHRQSQCRFQYLFLPHHPHPQSLAPSLRLGVDERRKSPSLHYLPEFNSIVPYVKEKDIPLTNVLLFPSYTILSSFLKNTFFLPLHQGHPMLLQRHQPHANNIYKPISHVPYAQNMCITLIISHLSHTSATH
jgi:hypothetical protein